MVKKAAQEQCCTAAPPGKKRWLPDVRDWRVQNIVIVCPVNTAEFEFDASNLRQ
jgi:hypothetical protein